MGSFPKRNKLSHFEANGAAKKWNSTNKAVTRQPVNTFKAI